MGAPKFVRLNPIQGAHFPMRGKVRDGSGKPVNLSGCEITFLTKESSMTDDAQAILVLSSTDPEKADRFPVGPNDKGIWEIILLPEDVDLHSPSVSLFFKVVLTLSNGQVRVPTIGTFCVEPN